ncbi:hypothetical protein [Orlajensenia leifsoniae]|uniref:Uncharacterized protein n=1 Tax=Orlajensenia leifsoniae TaxID=2561933 RepID=A0A4Y9QT69_9MICO|nr:hypothetical protein [Leifsonia flava]TFV94872.1 hypothetical protein E4M00_17105 [Leifsonia flava]
MLIDTPGAELLGYPTAAVLRVLTRSGKSLSRKQLATRTKLKNADLRATVERLSALGLVLIDADGEEALYTIDRHHVAWNSLSTLLTADEKIYQSIRNLVELQGEDEVSVAVAGPAAIPEANDHSIHVLVVSPYELSFDVPRELGNALIRTLGGATGSVIQVSICRDRESLDRVLRGTRIDRSRWLNSRTVHGPDVATLIRTDQRKHTGSNRGS